MVEELLGDDAQNGIARYGEKHPDHTGEVAGMSITMNISSGWALTLLE